MEESVGGKEKPLEKKECPDRLLLRSAGPAAAPQPPGHSTFSDLPFCSSSPKVEHTGVADRTTYVLQAVIYKNNKLMSDCALRMLLFRRAALPHPNNVSGKVLTLSTQPTKNSIGSKQIHTMILPRLKPKDLRYSHTHQFSLCTSSFLFFSTS